MERDPRQTTWMGCRGAIPRSRLDMLCIPRLVSSSSRRGEWQVEGQGPRRGGLLSEECMLMSSASVGGSGCLARRCQGGPSCSLLMPLIWVGGWVYSRYDHKMVIYFLKEHIIPIAAQDNIPFLPFFLLLETTNGMEFCSCFISGKSLLVLGRWDQFPAPEDFWFDLHL